MSVHATRTNEHGQTMAEYAVVLGVITPLILFAFTSLGSKIAQGIENVVALIPK